LTKLTNVYVTHAEPKHHGNLIGRRLDMQFYRTPSSVRGLGCVGEVTLVPRFTSLFLLTTKPIERSPNSNIGCMT